MPLQSKAMHTSIPNPSVMCSPHEGRVPLAVLGVLSALFLRGRSFQEGWDASDGSLCSCDSMNKCIAALGLPSVRTAVFWKLLSMGRAAVEWLEEKPNVSLLFPLCSVCMDPLSSSSSLPLPPWLPLQDGPVHPRPGLRGHSEKADPKAKRAVPEMYRYGCERTHLHHSQM